MLPMNPPNPQGASNASDSKERKESTTLRTLPKDALRTVGSFIDTSDLGSMMGRTNRFFHTLFSPEMAERKQAAELLTHVFNADPKTVAEFFTKPDVQPKIALTKTIGREGYFSKKLNKFVCFRRWKSVSPFQAAYLCGDGPFLGRKLLAYIINDKSLGDDAKDRLLKEARQQLRELLNRKNVNNAATTAAAKTIVATAAAASAAAVSRNNTADSKENAELCHGFSANRENEVADAAEFLAPIKELIKAYNAYLSRYPSLSSKDKRGEIDKLWEQVGECHKSLPPYVKQEFFGPNPFDPVPAFDTEPNRAECRYWNGDLLDLDGLGFGTSAGLYMARWGVAAAGGPPGSCVCCAVLQRTRGDLAAVSRLSELREADLRSTIDCLQNVQTFDSAFTLVANVETPRRVL